MAAWIPARPGSLALASVLGLASLLGCDRGPEGHAEPCNREFKLEVSDVDPNTSYVLEVGVEGEVYTGECGLEEGFCLFMSDGPWLVFAGRPQDGASLDLYMASPQTGVAPETITVCAATNGESPGCLVFHPDGTLCHLGDEMHSLEDFEPGKAPAVPE